MSIASVTTTLLLTDFAMSKLSNKLTPAALKFPSIKEILAINDFKIRSPNTGIRKTCLCHLYRIAGFLVVKYLKATTKEIIEISMTSPPVPLKKSLIAKITAVGLGKAIPIPSYIFANTGTTLININALTTIATVNIMLGYIKALLIFFFIFSFFSNASTIFKRKTSSLPLASPALTKFTYTLSNRSGYFSNDFDNETPPSRLFLISSTTSLIAGFST